MLIFKGICLLLSLFFIWTYIITGVHSKSHRLLPLILGLLVLYNFYELVEEVTGSTDVFLLLENLLFVQMLYLLVCYVVDYLEIKIHLVTHILLFAIMASVDVVVLKFPLKSTIVIWFMGTYATFCLLLFLASAVHVIRAYRYSIHELHINILLVASVTFPLGAILHEIMNGVSTKYMLSVSCEISVFIVWLLIITGSIIDTPYFLNTRVFQASDIPTVLLDPDYYYVMANEKAKETFPNVFEFEKKKGLFGNKAKKCFHDFSEKYDGLEEMIFGNYYRWQITEVYQKKRQRGYIVQLVDISQQKLAQEQAALKGQFLATSSHELRSPLHAIIGISDILASKKDLSTRNRVMVEHINQSGNTLLKTVNAILDFSKIEAGSFELTKRKYEIRPMLVELTRNALINLSNKPVEFELKVETEYPRFLIGDELRVRDMIQNIISNSVKFTEQGRISCRLSFEKKEGRYRMQCEVQDTGLGMSREIIKTIFDEYTSYSSETEGTGLGLSNVMRFAKLMDGDVFASSDGKSGSTVGFYILQEAVEGQELYEPAIFDAFGLEVENENTKPEVYPDYVCPAAKVLLADDMEVNRQIIRELTAPWGFQLDEAGDGTEAVELVREKRYDLIILDLRMPKMNGDVALEAIREITDTPVVLMSANLFDDSKQEYLDKGFAAALGKPLDLREIKRVIETMIPEEKLILSSRNKAVPKEEDSQKSLQNKVRTLKIFEGELRDIEDTIEDIFATDLELFRTKVHGIKGAARQLSFIPLAEHAEIIEMAAKAEHIDFIKRHMEDLIEEVKVTESDVSKKRAIIEKRIMVESEVAQMSEEEIHAVLVDMVKAFEAYDLSAIEMNIQKLKNAKLSAEIKQLVSEAEAAMDDFEYETGAKLLNKYLNR